MRDKFGPSPEKWKTIKPEFKERIYQNRLGNSGIPKKFQGKTLDDYSVGNSIAIERAKECITDFESRLSSGDGLCFVGSSRAGKTFLASIIAMEVLAQGYDVRFIHAKRFFDLLYTKIRTDDSDEWFELKEQFEKFNKHDLLVLDDVGKEYSGPSRFVDAEFEDLLRTRNNDLYPTIITTNIPVDEWPYKSYADSLVAFVKDTFDIVQF